MTERRIFEVQENFGSTDSERITAEHLMGLIDLLPLDEKINLCRTLLGKNGLDVVVHHPQASGNIIEQINTLDAEQLRKVLLAVAARVKQEGL
jgi:hypothetical protein